MKSLQMTESKSIRSALKNSAFSGYRAVKDFFDDTQGNISMMFGLSIVPILGLVALGTNYVYKNDAEARAISSLQAAALAMNRKADAEGYTSEILSDPTSAESQELRAFGKAFFEQNFGNISIVKDYNLDFELTSTNIIPVFSGSISTPLLGILGHKELEIHANTEVTLPGTGKIELALVLDVTGSMGSTSGSGTRMSVLKSAVDDMLTQLYGTDANADNPNVKTAIVPFSDAVNIKYDATAFDMDIMDTEAKSHYHGAHFFHTDAVDQDVEITYQEEEDQEVTEPDATCVAAGTGTTTTTGGGSASDYIGDEFLDNSGNDYVYAEFPVWLYGSTQDRFGFIRDHSDSSLRTRYVYTNDNSGFIRLRYNSYYNDWETDGSDAFTAFTGTSDPFYDPRFAPTTTTTPDPECTGAGERTTIQTVTVTRTETITYEMPVINADRKVNHFDLYKSDPVNMEWKGCVESRPYPLDEVDTPPGVAATTRYDGWTTRPSIHPKYFDSGYTADSTIDAFRDTSFTNTQTPHLTEAELRHEDNSRFVPWFYPDQSDCSDGACEYYATGADDAYGTFPGLLMRDGFDNGDYENRNFVRDYRFTKISDLRSALDDTSPDEEQYYHIVCQQRQNAVQDGLTVDTGDCYPSSDQVEEWKKLNERFKVTYSDWGIANHEYRLRSGYVGVWNNTNYTSELAALQSNTTTSTTSVTDNGTHYEGRYDLTKSINDNGTSNGSTGPNRRCSTPLLPLTSSKSALVAKMNQLTPGGHTNTSIGAIWGWRVLSPGAPFTEGVDLKYERDWSKAMVLMTDGQNTIATKSDGDHLNSAMNSNGFLWEDRQNVGQEAWKHNNNSDYKTVRICERMKKQGIRIYTVGFGISANSQVEKMLKACASNEHETYHLASNASQLLDAFNQITQEIKQLHVSR